MAVSFIVVLVFVFLLVFRYIYTNLWVPWRIQSHFKKRRVTGPRYRIFTGNSGEVSRLSAEAKSKLIPSGNNPHEFVHRVAPHYHAWSRVYGKTFLYWFGSKLVVATSDLRLIRESLTTRVGYLIESDITICLSCFTLRVFLVLEVTNGISIEESPFKLLQWRKSRGGCHRW